MENITDICELSDENTIISCLKQRFIQENIYTYVAKVLIAVNPYHDINGLYSKQKVIQYIKDAKDEFLPPHLYSIANRVLLNMSMQTQSVVLTGVTGSGKTKSALHLLSFISKSNEIGDCLKAANIIFESFGNAKTCYNTNSSRYTKLTKVFLHADQSLASIQMSYVLLESSRVHAPNEMETNFHIFYALLSSSAESLIKDFTNLHLDISQNYAFLSNCRDNNNRCSFQYIQAVDNAFSDIGVSNDEKSKIYKVLAAILNLGNVDFEEDISTGKSQVVEITQIHLCYAAKLLEIDAKVLETSLLTREMEIPGSNPIIIHLDVLRANKVRNSLSQSLYECVFQHIVNIVNKNSLGTSLGTSIINDPTLSNINLLDIAGFESFERGNHFEQLCINFINEKIQQMFVIKMIKNEEEWYASEDLEVPKIHFLDNTSIVDVYENKFRGIFKLLNDTGKMQCNTVTNFVEIAFANWKNCSILAKPRDNQNGFIIRHFTGNVLYNPNNFLEKNANILTKATGDICQQVCQSLSVNLDMKRKGWMNKCNENSTANILKMGTNELVNKLNQTECSFVRCIKPNANQRSGIFDEQLVRSQLNSSGSIAYQQLMRIGFPTHMSILELIDKFQLEFQAYTSIISNPKEFCNRLLRSYGLVWKDFKIGNTKIFFRKEKQEMLVKKIESDDLKTVKERFEKLNSLRIKFKKAIAFVLILARFWTMGSNGERLNEKQLRRQREEQINVSRELEVKKRKIIKKSNTPTQPRAQIFIQNTEVSNRKTIMIHSNNELTETLSTEDRLRNLLREERRKNEILQREYLLQQKTSVEIQTKMIDMQKEIERLTQDNIRYQNAYRQFVQEHDYV